MEVLGGPRGKEKIKTNLENLSNPNSPEISLFGLEKERFAGIFPFFGPWEKATANPGPSAKWKLHALLPDRDSEQGFQGWGFATDYVKESGGEGNPG